MQPYLVHNQQLQLIYFLGHFMQQPSSSMSIAYIYIILLDT